MLDIQFYDRLALKNTDGKSIYNAEAIYAEEIF